MKIERNLDVDPVSGRLVAALTAKVTASATVRGGVAVDPPRLVAQRLTAGFGPEAGSARA